MWLNSTLNTVVQNHNDLAMIVVSIFLTALWQFSSVASQNCSSFGTCSDCIQNLDCAWCSKTAFPFSRCFDEGGDFLEKCGEAYLLNPLNTVVLEEPPLEGSSIQVTPSSASLALRAGGSQEFNVSVYPQQDVPLDFYLLMDFSGSFANDLKTLKMHASDITAAIQNASMDTRFGFGAFVDKPTPPFSSSSQLNLLYTVAGQPSSCEPLPGVTVHCSRPFSYRHVVDLTNSSTLVNYTINNLVISASADDPEGTLDAMLQAVLCKDVIGWRNESRKLMLIFTNDVMHSAGDGRLAGIHTPHDGQCHTEFVPELNQTVYTATLDYDYPSLDQVKLSLLRNNVVPIFSVDSSTIVDFDKYFAMVANTFGGIVRPVPIDGPNIGALVSEAYQNISTSVKLTVLNPHEHIEVSITTYCPSNSTQNDSLFCLGLDEGDEVRFLVSVHLKNCTDHLLNGGSDSFALSIFGYNTITVDVSGECACPQCDASLCLQGLDGQVCSGRGDCLCINDVYECACNPSPVTGASFFGPACECSPDVCLNLTQTTDSNSLQCSGHGMCDLCAPPTVPPCSCDQGHYGALCQLKVECTDASLDCVMCHAQFPTADSSCLEQCAGYTAVTDSPSNLIPEPGEELCEVHDDKNGCNFTYFVGVTDSSQLYFDVISASCPETSSTSSFTLSSKSPSSSPSMTPSGPPPGPEVWYIPLIVVCAITSIAVMAAIAIVAVCLSKKKTRINPTSGLLLAETETEL